MQGRQLKVTRSSGKKQQVFSIDLLALDAASRQEWGVSRFWIGTTCFCLAGLAICLVFVEIDSVYVKTALAIFSLLGFLSVLFLVRGISHRRVFSSRLSKTPIFDIAINRPVKDVYRNFLRILQDEIHRSQESVSLSKEKCAAGEIRMLRRLSGQGIVSTGEYEKAKSQLLNL